MTIAVTDHKSAAKFVFDSRWRRRAIIAASLWFFACVLYGAPATLFESMLRKFLPQLQLQNVSGSFWNGSAAQAFWLQGQGGANGRVIALGGFEWHLQPWSLLWLHPTARVSTNYGEQFFDARLRVSPLGHLTLTQTSAALPAALLSNWAPVGARGQLALKLERAELSRKKIEVLNGALYWQQAQWQWNSRWLALGDYRCALSVPSDGKVNCAVQGQGALAIDGVVAVDVQERNWSTQLQVKIDTSLPDDFRQGAQLMLAAQPDAQGKYAVNRNGRW
ncbi:MAG: type II secretion system protein N [Spongiibacteraceae bacterium]